MIAKNLHRVTLKRSWDNTTTGRMGLVWLEQSMRHFGFAGMVDKEYGKKANREIAAADKLLAGAMSIIGGGERLEDIEILRADEGFSRNVGIERIAAADTLREYLKIRKNNNKQERINEAMVVKAMGQSAVEELTYDNDAVQVNSEKTCAAMSYKGIRQMSCLLGYIAELGLAVTADYRPGNVSPASGVEEQLKRAIRLAKKAKKRIGVFRCDSVGHQNEIMELCERENIRYFISMRKLENVREQIRSIKAGEWKPLREADGTVLQEYGERVHISQKGVLTRMLVLRRKNEQRDLFEDEYRYHAICTNDLKIGVAEWLAMHNGRMNSENYHKELKYGCNIGYAPSHNFELSRGYFLLNVLAYNMAQVMKLYYLGEPAREWTLKTLRQRFVQVCGKVVKTGRKYYCKILNVCDSVYELFEQCQARIVTG